MCPVSCFELYVSKLNPKRDDLWQKPKKKLIDGTEQYWYVNQVVGKDKLNDAMKKLSINAKLSRFYTNHCIRATVMGIFDEYNFASRHIMFHCGHKSESSIKQYARNVPTKTKRDMSHALAQELNNEIPKKIAKISEETISVPQQNAAEIIQQEKNPITIPSATENPPEIVAVPVENAAQVVPAENLIPNEAQFDEGDDYLGDKNLIKILEKIENENQHLFPANQNLQAVVPHNKPPVRAQASNKALNISNVSNVSNKNAQPVMYFNNSTVTINTNGPPS